MRDFIITEMDDLKTYKKIKNYIKSILVYAFENNVVVKQTVDKGSTTTTVYIQIYNNVGKLNHPIQLTDTYISLFNNMIHDCTEELFQWAGYIYRYTSTRQDNILYKPKSYDKNKSLFQNIWNDLQKELTDEQLCWLILNGIFQNM